MRCCSCKTEKPDEAFAPSVLRRKDSSKTCRACRKEKYGPKYRQYNIKKFYGLDIKIYNEMLEIWNHRCPICLNNFGSRPPHVDHDHETGRVRGLLCGGCNTGLGSFKENITALKRAIKYLRLFIAHKNRKPRRG